MSVGERKKKKRPNSVAGKLEPESKLTSSVDLHPDDDRARQKPAAVAGHERRPPTSTLR